MRPPLQLQLPALAAAALCLWPYSLPAATSKQIHPDFGKLPLRFEKNAGQFDPAVDFVARGRGYGLLLGRSGAAMVLSRQAGGAAPPAVLTMRLIGADAGAPLVPEGRLVSHANYFIGSEASGWRTGIPEFARVVQKEAYPGVDLVYYGNEGQLEYDLVVRDSRSLPRIRVRFDGASRTRLTPEGDLILTVDGGRILLHRPVIYQEKNGTRDEIGGRYVRTRGDTFAFRVGAFDPALPLVIDPRISYSTFIGGSGWDEGVGIAIDGSGNTYITGWTTSTNYPVSAGAPQPAFAGGGIFGDAFVTKLNAAGTAVLYSTYVGGSGDDLGWAVAVDASGSAYVAGYTQSSNFPTTPGAFQRTMKGARAGFAFKLNAAGTSLDYSTYITGSGEERALGIAADPSGAAYVVGRTTSSDFPVTVGAPQFTHAAYDDGFALKLNPSGSALVYSTFLGGNGVDFANALTIDAAGNAYVCGYTQSTNFPVTAGAFQTAFGGGPGDAFVTKVNPTGTAFVYSTFLGGSADEYARGIAVDASSFVYVGGRSASPNFPTTAGAFQTANAGDNDSYVAKLKVDGSGLVYSTLIGGAGMDQVEGIGVDAAGNAYLAEITQSSNFPTTADGAQRTLRGSQNSAFSVVNATGTALIYSTYLGGSSSDAATNIAVDGAGNAYVTGVSSSSDFPTTSGSYQPNYGGGTGDAFVTRFDPCTYAISPASQSAPISGGPFSFGVTAPAACTWTAASNVAWITIASGASGTGNGTVGFSVASNPGAARTGTITAAGQTFTVEQAGTCTFSISPASQSFTLTGGTGTVSVTTTAGCAWTAASNASWLTITSGASGSGNGTVGYSVASAGAPRTGTATIAGSTFTVNQTSTSFNPIRVHAGGGAYTDNLSQVWAADTGFSGGSTYSTANTIAGTTTPGLYQSERYGVFQYVFTVPNNSYTVKLKFAELYWSQPGQRVFNVAINGQNVLTNFDIIAQAGAYTAIDKQFTVNVTGGSIAIQFIAVVENPKVNAIEIVPYSGVGISVTPTAATLTAGQIQTITPTVTGTANTGVTWTLFPATGTLNAGTYTAPATVSTTQKVTITATSQADTSQSANTTITLQPAPTCTYSLSPTSQSIGTSGGNGTFTVSTLSGCSWTATSNAAWITLTSGTAGSGTGSVGFSVAANVGPARTGTITAGGQTFTVTQASDCSYSISPLSQDLTLSGGTGSVTVTAAAGCSWTASSNAAWLSITGGATGTGNGTVTFSAASTSLPRTGTLTVAGNAFTVNQVSPGPIRVNAGGGNVTDPQGQVWYSDAGYSGGQTYATSSPIGNTTVPQIYQTERYGAFSYRYPVANGTYTVVLKFAEIYFNSAGKRVFNVAINGQTVLTNFDIFAQAGSFTAIDKQFTVNVTGGAIAIQFIPVVENPKVSAIQIF